jgi:CheY-like chemotaxis protein
MVPRMVLPSTTHESRLLLVDDAPSNRKMVKRILQSSFGQIDEAENGMQAVCMVEAAMMAGAPYHLVMMDFMMPVMNGLEATKCIKKWVREHSAGRNSILVVGVTGNGLEEDIQAFREAGADDVLLKPLNLAHFLNIFKRYYRLP